MPRKKSEFVRAHDIVGRIWKALVNEVFDQGGDDDDLRRVETDAALRKEIATLIVGKKKNEALKPVPPPLLTLISTVAVLAAKRFVAAEHFVRNLSADAPAKISYVGEQFKEWFGGKVEERPSDSEASPNNGPYRTPGNGAATSALRYHTLNRGSMDAPIIAELGGEARAETTLAEIHALLYQQPSGEQGALLTNGYANIFYVRDANGVLRVVRAAWDGGGWRVLAFSVEDPDEWHAGLQLFSRDS